MKAFFVPVALLSLILLTCALTGIHVCKSTDHWIDTLNDISELASSGKWEKVKQSLSDAEEQWLSQTAIYHIFMEHQDLDEAEKLFSGALAACQVNDEVELKILLAQLITQLEFLAETQKISWQNVF